jgi:cyclophilin family peptidyl-prolyl cis-trans isomerase
VKTLIPFLILLLPLMSLAVNPKVVFETNKGKIVMELYPDKAPVTVKNFLTYVDEKFYDGTVFHRIVPGFVIQGGGMAADLKEKANHPPIKNEADNKLSNLKYTVCMARTGDPHSATSQFFINLVDNQRLDYRDSTSGSTWGYAVFGKVVEGMDVVDAIAKVPTTTVGQYQGVPVDPVTVAKAYRKK